jgi:hypothetical protein
MVNNRNSKRVIINMVRKKQQPQRNRKRKQPQTYTKPIMFTQAQSPEYGRLLPSYRKFLAKRSQRINTAKRTPNNTKAARRIINPYVQCRLMPFSSSNGMGIPDATDAKRLVVDHRQITSFVVGSGGAFNIIIAPVMPQIIWYQVMTGDNTYSVNGGTPTVHNGAVDGFHHVTCAQYQGITFTRNDFYGKINSIPVYLGATRARIVTIGYRIIYTGSTMNNSGSITINRMGMSLITPQANLEVFKIQSDHGTSDEDISAGQVIVYRSNLSTNTFESMTQETVRFPLRQGATGLLKHASGDYRWLDVTDNETYIAKASDDSQSLLYQAADLGLDTLARWPIVTFADDQWSPAAIAVRGATAGQSFDIETVYCVEYIPNVDSSSSSLAKQPPRESMKSIDSANKASRNLPLAGALSVFSTAVKVASSVAPILM